MKNEEGVFKKFILNEDELSKLIDQAESRQTEIAVLAIVSFIIVIYSINILLLLAFHSLIKSK